MKHVTETTEDLTFYRVRNEDQEITFIGELLGESSSWRSDKGRWVEIYIYRTHAGKYVVNKIGRSRVYHLRSCPKVKARTDLNSLDPTEDGLIPCDVCHPRCPSTDHLLEREKHWAQVSEQPEGIIEGLYMMDADGASYLPSTNRRALDTAMQHDEAFRRAYAVRPID